jgi:hypothetical protein
MDESGVCVCVCMGAHLCLCGKANLATPIHTCAHHHIQSHTITHAHAMCAPVLGDGIGHESACCVIPTPCRVLLD